MILIIYSPGTNQTLGGSWSSTWKLAETIAKKGKVKIILDANTHSWIRKEIGKCPNIDTKVYPNSYFASKLGQILICLCNIYLFFVSSSVIVSSPSNSSFNFLVGSKCYRFIHSEIGQSYGKNFFEKLGRKNYLAASHYLYDKLIERGIKSSKCRILVNIPENTSLRKTKKIGNKGKIITAAQFSPYRLNELWLSVAAEITQSHPKWEFHWFGAENEVQTDNSNIFIHKFEPNISKLLGEYDIYLNLTKFETHGLSVLEAMSWGLPVVTSEVGNMKYLIVDKYDGFLVQNKFLNVCDAVENLIADAELRNKIGEEAQHKYIKMKKDYNFEEQVNAIFELS